MPWVVSSRLGDGKLFTGSKNNIYCFLHYFIWFILYYYLSILSQILCKCYERRICWQLIHPSIVWRSNKSLVSKAQFNVIYFFFVGTAILRNVTLRMLLFILLNSKLTAHQKSQSKKGFFTILYCHESRFFPEWNGAFCVTQKTSEKLIIIIIFVAKRK